MNKLIKSLEQETENRKFLENEFRNLQLRLESTEYLLDEEISTRKVLQNIVASLYNEVLELKQAINNSQNDFSINTPSTILNNL